MRRLETQQVERPWVLIAAYDVSTGATSEGYVALNILQRLSKSYRVILVTRQNNRDRLLASADSLLACNGMRIIGFDLPRWASWWKQGKRFYFPYAYLWQLLWPLALFRRKRLKSTAELCHVLNFHNDSIPSFAWILDLPVVWGPLNHNELPPQWRQSFWPQRVRTKARIGFLLRRLAWLTDPWLRLTRRKACIVLSAGPWVDRRLGVKRDIKTVHLSQLGVDASVFALDGKEDLSAPDNSSRMLVHAGRLDWIKGLDVAIEALDQLPKNFQLILIGSGPAEESLRILVEQMGLGNRVIFRPHMSRKELSIIYSKAELFLFPSSEAAGLAWVEALACGLPVAGFAGDSVFSLMGHSLPGLNLVLESSQNRTVNIENYAKLIKDVVSQPHCRGVIRDKALEKFGWDSLSTEIMHLYEQYRKKRL